MRTYSALEEAGAAALADPASALYLDEERLQAFLAAEFSRADRGQRVVSREAAERVLLRVPLVRLSRDETWVAEVALGFDRRGAQDWREWRQTLPLLMRNLRFVLLSRYIGRRLTMVAENEAVQTLPLRKLAERLLHVVRVVEGDAGAELLLPDAEALRPEGDDEDTAAGLGLTHPVVRTLEVPAVLPVLGHPALRSLSATLRFTVASSEWRASSTATATVLLPAEEGALPPPLPLTFTLPSMAAVDDDEADKYLLGLAPCFTLQCRDDCYPTLGLRPADDPPQVTRRQRLGTIAFMPSEVSARELLTYSS